MAIRYLDIELAVAVGLKQQHIRELRCGENVPRNREDSRID